MLLSFHHKFVSQLYIEFLSYAMFPIYCENMSGVSSFAHYLKEDLILIKWKRIKEFP
jgi:hypothetical protein